jgi:hypothetical protein
LKKVAAVLALPVIGRIHTHLGPQAQQSPRAAVREPGPQLVG